MNVDSNQNLLAKQEALDAWFKLNKCTRADIARHIGVSRPRVWRMFKYGCRDKVQRNKMLEFGLPEELLPHIPEPKKRGPKPKNTGEIVA